MLLEECEKKSVNNGHIWLLFTSVAVLYFQYKNRSSKYN